MLKPAAFYILLALAEGDRHGYAIMQAVRENSEGRLPLRTGSLYRHLTELVHLGLVDEKPPPKQATPSRRGTHYRLTRAGRAALEEESRRLAGLVRRVERLRLSPRRGDP